MSVSKNLKFGWLQSPYILNEKETEEIVFGVGVNSGSSPANDIVENPTVTN